MTVEVGVFLDRTAYRYVFWYNTRISLFMTLSSYTHAEFCVSNCRSQLEIEAKDVTIMKIKEQSLIQ